ncbi:MAG: hypothetical protein AcusKO_03120 [Acuticoccus sp.]
MRRVRILKHKAFVALLCMTIAAWSVVPAVTHAPAVYEAIGAHAQFAAEHGHSHGFDDVLRILHGHGPEAADHDHTQALPARGEGYASALVVKRGWQLRPSDGWISRLARIERPPRA